MTDNEAICTAIVGGFTVLGAAVRWSAGIVKGVAMRVVKAMDDSTAAWNRTSETVSTLTQKLVEVDLKLNFANAVQQTVEQAVEAVVDEVSGVHGAAKTAAAEKRTPVGGYHIVKERR